MEVLAVAPGAAEETPGDRAVFRLVKEAERGRKAEEGPAEAARREAMLAAAEIVIDRLEAGEPLAAIAEELRTRARQASEEARGSPVDTSLEGWRRGWWRAAFVLDEMATGEPEDED